MAFTRQTGFPASGDTVITGTTQTQAITTVAIGDLLVAVGVIFGGAASHTLTMSGGGATGWTAVQSNADSTHGYYITLWYGTVTQPDRKRLQQPWIHQ